MLSRYPRAALGALLILNIIGYLDRSMLMGFSPQITKDLGLTNTQFGFLSGAVWVFSYSVMVLVLGTLADRVSRTRLIAGGMLVWSACTAASGYAGSFEQMVVARFLVAAGEAALVPAATAILADIFDGRHRSTANGVFFMGIPLGVGAAYLLSGTVGAGLGWRDTFLALGIVGVLLSFIVAAVPDVQRKAEQEVGENFLPQMKAILATLRRQPAIVLIIAGFVIVHLVYAQNSFIQLWLVRERGFEEAAIARYIGVLQIAFGCLGAVGGGIAADRLAKGHASRMALFPALCVAVCLPLMIAGHLAEARSSWIYIGLAASFLLPFSIYGSSLSLVQGSVPHSMRASVIGFSMMCLNVFAMALGTVTLGFASDRLAAAGNATPLTAVLVGSDLAIGVAFVLFLIAARWVAPATEARSFA